MSIPISSTGRHPKRAPSADRLSVAPVHVIYSTPSVTIADGQLSMRRLLPDLEPGEV